MMSFKATCQVMFCLWSVLAERGGMVAKVSSKHIGFPKQWVQLVVPGEADLLGTRLVAAGLGS